MVRSFMHTIGANYNNAVEQAMSPGRGPDGSNGYYIEDPTGTMSCAEMQTNFDALENQIQYWFGILQTGSNNSTERENLNKVINIQRTKKDAYANLMLRNCSNAPQTTDPGTPDPYPTPEPTPDDQSKGGIMTFITANPLLIAAIVVGVIVIVTQMNKRPRRAKRRKAA